MPHAMALINPVEEVMEQLIIVVATSIAIGIIRLGLVDDVIICPFVHDGREALIVAWTVKNVFII